jgi:hypothetical protein
MVKKKNQRPAPLRKQKSRAKYKCPPELEELIRQTNLVPIRTITPDFDVEIRMEIQRLKDETGEPSPEISAYEFLTKLIEHLPSEFLDFIKREAYKYVYPFGEGKFSGDERQYKQEFVRLYVRYCDMRDSMLWLVQRLETERQMMRDAEKRRQLKENSITFQYFTLLDWDAFPITIKTSLIRGDAGKLQITGLAALIGKFDDSRLRKCKVCELIYWAKRENSKTCSPRCLNILNVRKSRSLTDEEKAERKAQREKNKQYKQKLIERKKKKNGTL